MNNGTSTYSPPAEPSLRFSFSIREFRESLVNKTLNIYGVLGFLALMVSLSRFYDHGWRPVFTLRILGYLALLSVVAFKRYLPFQWRTFILLGFLFADGLLALFSFGLTGRGILILVTFSVLTLVYQGPRLGTIAFGVSLAAVGVSGFFISQKWVFFPIPFENYLISPFTWLTHLIGFILLAAIMLYNIGSMQDYRQSLNESLEKTTADLRDKEGELLDINQMLENVLDTIPVRVFWKDKNLNYLGCNRLYAQDLGYQDPSELVGKDDTHFVDEKEAEFRHNADHNVMESQIPILDQERSFQTADGKTIWLKVIVIPMRNRAGEIEGVLGAYEDISDRKNAEKTYRLTRQTVDYASDAAIWLLGGKIVYVNKKACKMGGYSREEFLELNDYDVLPILKSKEWKYLWETIKAQESLTFEAESIIKGGKSLLVEITANYLTFEGEEYCIAFARDITYRKQAEDELWESMERLDLALNASRLGVWDWDLRNNAMYFSERWTEVLGYETIESPLMYERFQDHIISDDRPKLEFLMGEMFSGKRKFLDTELRFLTKGDELVWLQVQGKVVDWTQNGTPSRVIGVGRDVTSEKVAEKSILEYQRQLKYLTAELIEAGDRERKQIATDLHDGVCQYLAMANVYLSVFTEYEQSTERKEDLDRIQKTLKSAYELSRDLTNDLYSPVLSELGLEAAIEQLLDKLKKETGLRIRFFQKGPKVILKRNMRSLVYRMVRELLTNVQKHAKARRVNVMVSRTPANLFISIYDDGQGFVPNHPLPSSERHTKFGLFSIREQLSRIGGTMEIDSKPSGGTKVSLGIFFGEDDTIDGGARDAHPDSTG